MSDRPPFLAQQAPRLSIKESENIVDEILSKLEIRLPKNEKYKQSISKTGRTGKEERKEYRTLVDEVRKYGICSFIQESLDHNDEVFGGTFGVSTNTSSLKIISEWGEYKKELKGPCRNVPSEIDISEDIEFYKDESCIESDSQNLDMCVRNYRGYLFSSIALIDCYINRHILYFKARKLNSKRFTDLENSRNLEERIEIFVELFCIYPMAELKSNIIWDNFKKLKNLRNEVIHAIDPYMGIELREMASNLNLSINGVGSLLKKLQEGQGRVSLGFIERVRTSPVIHFNQITSLPNGKHKTKQIISKTIRK